MQVERAVQNRLAGPGPGPDQMVAVMDAVGASSWQVPCRYKHVATCNMNQHPILHLAK